MKAVTKRSFRRFVKRPGLCMCPSGFCWLSSTLPWVVNSFYALERGHSLSMGIFIFFLHVIFARRKTNYNNKVEEKVNVTNIYINNNSGFISQISIGRGTVQSMNNNVTNQVEKGGPTPLSEEDICEAQ
ncbi:MAG: hypothetical protein Q4D36_05390 [Bacteroidales bacterium]|nr:hypothetical protein [Bacteroidales bacterium]